MRASNEKLLRNRNPCTIIGRNEPFHYLLVSNIKPNDCYRWDRYVHERHSTTFAKKKLDSSTVETFGRDFRASSLRGERWDWGCKFRAKRRKSNSHRNTQATITQNNALVPTCASKYTFYSASGHFIHLWIPIREWVTNKLTGKTKHTYTHAHSVRFVFTSFGFSTTRNGNTHVGQIGTLAGASVLLKIARACKTAVHRP